MRVSDAEILSLVEQTLPKNKKDIFDWYSALMDYGSTLPKIIKHNPNRASKHYTKQSKFEGSNRQKRGQLLADLLEKKTVAIREYDIDVIKQLEKEGFVIIKNKKVILK
jgi:A/G-specific adenine glycosylase